jgi:hypothetical protein
MNERMQIEALRQQASERTRAVAQVLRQLAVRDVQLRAHLAGLQARVRVLDGQGLPNLPPLPPLRIPDALAGLLEEEE